MKENRWEKKTSRKGLGEEIKTRKEKKLRREAHTVSNEDSMTSSLSRLEDVSLKQLGEQPHSDMDVVLRDRVVQLCKQAFDVYEKSSDRGKEERESALISKYLKELLDANLGPNWMVIVGQAYSAQFTCASKSYWHFFFRKNYITCFKTTGA